MKILFINVALRPKSPLRLVPMGLAYVMSAVRNAGYTFDLLDIDFHRFSEEEIETYVTAHRYDVVCLGTIVTGYRVVKQLADLIRQIFPQTVIIVGNTVGSSITDIIFEKTAVDVVAMGEADETIIELLKAVETQSGFAGVQGILYRDSQGDIVHNPDRKAIADIDSIPIPHWDIFEGLEAYIHSASQHLVSEPFPIPHDQIRAFPVAMARGCAYQCTFCYHAFRGQPFRYRSPQSIVDEFIHLQKNYRINYILNSDDLSFFSKKQANAFLDHLIASDLEIYWIASCRSGLFSEDGDVELVRKFRQAGCVGLAYSLESSDPEILRWMNKKATAEQFKRQTEILHRGGLAVWTSLVIGYPNETEETIRKTIDYCAGCGVYPSVGYLLPQPGTPMFDYACEHGFIDDKEAYLLAMGDRQDLRLNMTGLSDDQLQSVVLESLESCNNKVGAQLTSEQLIKSGFYRAKRS